jgi:hypothetical protein
VSDGLCSGVSVSYEGEWVALKPHGQGTKLLRDGTRFEGLWAGNGLRSSGRQDYPNGNIFEVIFEDSHCHCCSYASALKVLGARQ